MREPPVCFLVEYFVPRHALTSHEVGGCHGDVAARHAHTNGRGYGGPRADCGALIQGFARLTNYGEVVAANGEDGTAERHNRRHGHGAASGGEDTECARRVVQATRNEAPGWGAPHEQQGEHERKERAFHSGKSRTGSNPALLRAR